MTKKEKMQLIRQAEKLSHTPVLNPNYKKGRRSNAEIYNGVVRNKYINEWID